MNVQDAVAAAFDGNYNWMPSHTGIVNFILSEQKPGFSGNSDYDEVILANPEEARGIARVLDGASCSFHIDLSVTIPGAVWRGAYGVHLDEDKIGEWIQKALFINTEHIPTQVHGVLAEGN